MKKKGFTLIGLMLALAIFTLVMTFLYTTFFSQIRSYNSTNDENHIQYNARNAMELIVDEVRGADSNISVTNNSISANGSTLIGTNTMNADLNFNSASGTLTDKDGNVLCRQISGLSFRTDSVNASVIVITIDLSSGKETFELVSGVNISG